MGGRDATMVLLDENGIRCDGRKIDSGVLVPISPSKVPRLIGKKGSMIQMIEMGTNAAITIGQNGWVVVSCETPEGLSKAKKAIEMVNEKAHIANLTDLIKDMLDGKDES
jgi:exosome complex component RRP4